MARIRAFMIIIIIMFLMLTASASAWADYTITVTNEKKIEFEGRILVKLTSQGQITHDFNNGNPISPKKTVTESFTKSPYPTCWDTISVKPYAQWPYCSTTDQWTSTNLNKCSNNTVILKPNLGCGISIEVR